MGETACWWCGSQSTRLCDAMIGCERRASDRTLIPSEAYTCDAPICDNHARQIGHVCGPEHDSMDLCPDHAPRGLKFNVNTLADSAGDAEKLRRAVRSRAWRSRMRVVDGVGEKE